MDHPHRPAERSAAIFAVLFLFIHAPGAWAANVPKTLHAFTFNDGSSLYSSLTLDAAGNVYGTTVEGGTHNAGLVYEISPVSGGKWKETALYNFKGGSQDGSGSHATPVFDSAGNMYGTTPNGGLKSPKCNAGCGVVFKLSPPQNGGPWIETILHEFTGGSDGAVAYAGVVLDSSGNLYGATTAGGAAGLGTVYELSPTSGGGWQETVLYNFGGAPDGATAYSTPILDKAGNLYGTTYEGSAHNHGTVYELSHASGVWTEQILCSFKGGNDGDEPFAGVIFDQAGNIYGTTAEGGTANVGTAFKLTAANGWKKTILHQFLGLSAGDGANPNGLIFDALGNLYGSTVGGGSFNPGTIFRMTHSSSGWKETVLYSFTGGNDGAFPSAGLSIDPAGHLYGTTLWGGPAGDTVGGVAFEFIP
ncbi:MAG: choice-of-anchor tandem repeat GloVer-containing protein [Candidatus Sulfotelmatobacter sp.]